MVDTGPNVLGNSIAGLSSDSWYSIQAFASDYYLGLNGTTSDTPVAAQLSNVEDSTLWQFVAAGPDTSQGVYALRSKSVEGRFCLYEGCDGPDICVAPPVVQPCGNDAGQFQLYNSSSEGGGVIFVNYQSAGRSALWVSSGSSEGEAVEGTDLAVSNTEEGGYLWAIRSEETVDDAAFPVTFTPTYATISSTANATVSTSFPSSGQSSTQTTLTTTTPQASSTDGGSSTDGATSSTSAAPTGTTASPTTGSSSPAQQTDSSAPRTDLSMKAVLAGLAYLSFLGLSI